MLIDTHCHINVKTSVPWEVKWEQCQLAGVSKIIAPGTDISTSQEVIQFASRIPRQIYAAVGIHPQVIESFDIDFFSYPSQENLCSNDFRKHSDSVSMYHAYAPIQALIQQPEVIAVGEIGLDWEVSEPSHSVQEVRLRNQLHIAYQNHLPVLLHCRKAFGRLQEIIAEFHQQYGYSPGGILHSWAGSVECMQFFISLGFYYGVSGVITQSKATRKRAVLKELPLSKMVLETDAPYIGIDAIPKGEVEPFHLPRIALAVAELLQLPTQEICQITTENAIHCLHLT